MTAEEFRARISRTSLLVHPHDMETPVESLRLHVYVKPAGYLKDAIEKAERCASIYVARGDAYLMP